MLDKEMSGGGLRLARSRSPPAVSYFRITSSTKLNLGKNVFPSVPVEPVYDGIINSVTHYQSHRTARTGLRSIGQMSPGVSNHERKHVQVHNRPRCRAAMNG